MMLLTTATWGIPKQARDPMIAGLRATLWTTLGAICFSLPRTSVTAAAPAKGEMLPLRQDRAWGNETLTFNVRLAIPEPGQDMHLKAGIARRTSHVQAMLREVPILRDDVGDLWCHRGPFPIEARRLSRRHPDTSACQGPICGRLPLIIRHVWNYRVLRSREKTRRRSLARHGWTYGRYTEPPRTRPRGRMDRCGRRHCSRFPPVVYCRPQFGGRSADGLGLRPVRYHLQW